MTFGRTDGTPGRPAGMADPDHRHERLIIVRPGQAVGKRAWPGPPETRPLTPKGRKQVVRLARFLAAREVDVSIVACGLQSRDRETAELLSAWLDAPVMMDPRIAAGLTVAGLSRLLDDLAARDPREGRRGRPLLVAHDPVASMLLVLLTDSPGVDLDAGAAASLRIHGPIEPGCASLGWLVAPAMLRGLRARRGDDRRSGAEPRTEVGALTR